MIDRLVGAHGETLLVGPVRGLASEVAPLLTRLAAFGPESIGLGISPDELAGLVAHFVDRPAEPLVSLTGTETAEVLGLGRYGEVRVPNPSLLGVLRWAQARQIPVTGLDPSDATYADLFSDHISYIELVRRTLRERRLTRDPPAPSTPDEFAESWHRTISKGRGSRRFDHARDLEFVEGARVLRASARRVALVVDRERFEGVLQALRAPPA